VTDLKYTRTLTPEGALKVLTAAIVEATRMGQPLATQCVSKPVAVCRNGNIPNAERELTRQLSVEFECNNC
jgi:hypothetical protein